MEGILTLVVVIIVFNLINALLKALRGDRTAHEKLAPARAEVQTTETPVLLKRERIDPFSGLDLPELKAESDSFSEPETGLEQVPESIYMSRADSQWNEDVISQEDGDRKVIYQTEEKLTSCPIKAVHNKDSVKMSLKQVLSQKEPLVAAFIFHEVLGLPPSKRGKR